MKKILHLSHTEIPHDSRILKEMDSACKNGYKVYGIGIKLDESTKPIVNNKLKITTLNLLSKKLKLLPDPIRHLLTFSEFFIKSVSKSIKLQPDLIHCNDTLVLPIGVFIKLFSKSKLVYDAHELESDRNGLSRLLGKSTLQVEKRLWKFIDGLIVVSPSIEKWYLENIGDKESTIVFNSPIFDRLPIQKSDYLRKKFAIPNDSKVFIYIGILGAGRGLDLIIESFKNVKDAHVVFLGYGEYSSKIKGLEKDHSNIHLHEAVEHNKVVEIASSADVGLCLIENVSLSDYYCLPNKLFEYVFGGIPVLASNFPDIRHVIEKYKLGVCVDLDAKSIQNGINAFTSGDFIYNPKHSDLSELSWDTQEQNLINLYERIYAES